MPAVAAVLTALALLAPAVDAPAPSTTPAATPPAATPPAAPPPAATPATTPAAPRAEPASKPMTPEQIYKHGKNLFEYQDCPGTIETLAPLAVPGQLQDEDEQLDVHRMLGICYALADKPKPLEAAREFSSLLSINPDFALDPFLTPPAAIEIFDRQKAAMKVQLEELRRARERAKADAVDEHGGVLIERTTVVKEVPLAVAFMPFGLAQAANGSTTKAVIVGAAEGVTAASTVALFWTSILMLLLDDKVRTDQPEQDVYHAVLDAQFISALAFAGLYVYGVGDALYDRDDGGVVDTKQTRRRLTPEELRHADKIAPTPKATPDDASR